jgi:hypothetical protein
MKKLIFAPLCFLAAATAHPQLVTDPTNFSPSKCSLELETWASGLVQGGVPGSYNGLFIDEEIVNTTKSPLEFKEWVKVGSLSVNDCQKSSNSGEVKVLDVFMEEAEHQVFKVTYPALLPSLEDRALAESHDKAYNGLGLTMTPTKVRQEGKFQPMVYLWSRSPMVKIPALIPRAKCKVGSREVLRRLKSLSTHTAAHIRTTAQFYSCMVEVPVAQMIPKLINPVPQKAHECRASTDSNRVSKHEIMLTPLIYAAAKCSRGTPCCP